HGLERRVAQRRRHGTPEPAQRKPDGEPRDPHDDAAPEGTCSARRPEAERRPVAEVEPPPYEDHHDRQQDLEDAIVHAGRSESRAEGARHHRRRHGRDDEHRDDDREHSEGSHYVVYAALKWTYSTVRSEVSIRPVPRPRCRSRSTENSRRPIRPRARRSASGIGRPRRETTTSPIRTSTRSTSIAAPAVPAPHTKRPQFGAPPAKAALPRVEVPTARAMRAASSSLRAPRTRTSTSRVLPSPSSTTRRASS